MKKHEELVTQNLELSAEVSQRKDHFVGVRGRKPLGMRQQRDFRKLVERFQDDIVRKWVEFFVLHKRVKPELIPRRLP